MSEIKLEKRLTCLHCGAPAGWEQDEQVAIEAQAELAKEREAHEEAKRERDALLQDRVVQCSFCGKIDEPGDLDNQARLMWEHMQTCERHPMRALEQRLAELEPVLADVVEERARQDSKWGEQNHDPFTYLAILTEEVGEAAQAALHDQFGGKHAGTYRTELVQIAAVAIAMIECVDRAARNAGVV